MKTRRIRQSVTFTVSPHEVYEALMDSRKHARFTGAKASISRKVGGKFSVYDGSIEGENLELVPDERIVQTWRMGEWTDGHYSKVTFAFRPADGGTRLTLSHSGVPEGDYEDVKQGWKEYYWQPMKEMFTRRGEQPTADS